MDDPEKAWPLVQDAILAFGSQVPDIAACQAALREVMSREAWKYYVPPIGEPCVYSEITEWVEAKVPRGLDTTVENLRRIAEGDVKLRDALDKALKNPAHAHPDVNNVHVRPEGNSKDRALRKLRTDAPELHARVLNNELSPHAAMIEAGFRKRTITVPVEQPESAARTLRRHMSPEDIERLKELL